jgi:hypothetical protein
MDPATAAGIGLAVMSLASQCFTGAMQGIAIALRLNLLIFANEGCAAIQLISSAKNLAPEYKYLTIRLRLEQQRLCNWGAEVGLQRYIDGNVDADADHLDMLGLNKEIIIDTIFQIQMLATDFIECQKKFGVLVPDDFKQTGQEPMGENLNDSSLTIFPDIMDFLKKQRHVSPLIKSLPKRLKWAAFYREKYEGLIDRLRGFNDVLIDLVDSNARIAICRSTRETNTTILHLHSRIDDLLQLFRALLPENSAGVPVTPAATSPYDSNLYTQQKRDLAGLAYFKAVNISIESNFHLTFAGPRAEERCAWGMKLARSDIHLSNDLESTDDRCEADYELGDGQSRQRVWVEWREYDPLMQAQTTLHPSRVDKLVSLLSDVHKPNLLCVPHCIGYFDDPRCKENNYRTGRLGFVFEKPSPVSASPVSLRSLIMLRNKPLLTDRIAIAKAIANCLMSLHSVNWLHKGLRSQNILFFPKDGSTVEYSCPYLSGFGYARPAFREDMTEMMSQNPEADMYRHPRTHGLGPWEGRQGFKRTFDVYSLGVVLVEIATWQVIETVLEIEDPQSLSASALKDIQSRLLGENRHLESIGANAGAKFRRATESCLDSTAALGVNHLDDEMNVHVAAKISRSFYHQVLLPLDEIQT